MEKDARAMCGRSIGWPVGERTLTRTKGLAASRIGGSRSTPVAGMVTVSRRVSRSGALMDTSYVPDRSPSIRNRPSGSTEAPEFAPIAATLTVPLATGSHSGVSTYPSSAGAG
jgi:hypothetical protein